MFFLLPIFLIVLFAFVDTEVLADSRTINNYSQPEKQPYIFLKNRPSPELVNLGRLLFFDVRLSGNNTMSCASCHRPAQFWSDSLPTGIGLNGKVLRRATPTLINVAYNKKQFWDGRAHSLEQQSTMPIESPEEMNQDLDELVNELQAIPGYVKLFNSAFRKNGVTRSNISRSISAFQRSLVSNNTPFDRWYRGDSKAISESAKRGFKLHEGKAGCSKCHFGFNFSNDDFHNIGLKPHGDKKDLGRYVITKNPSHKGAFKTPTLRNIVNTAPYMHNGIYNTLEEVIEHYDRGGDVRTNIDKKMKKLNLTEAEEKDLVEFLKTLTENVSVEIPRHFPQ